MRKYGGLAHIDWLYCEYIQPVVAPNVTHSVCMNVNSANSISVIETIKRPVNDRVFEIIKELTEHIASL